MDHSESLTVLPQAEVNECYIEDESSPSKDSSFHYHEDEVNNRSMGEGCGNISQLRKRLSHIIHGQTYQIAVIVLVLIDAATVLAILIIDTSVKDSHSHGAKLATEIFHYISICILFSFMIEHFGGFEAHFLIKLKRNVYDELKKIVVKIFALGLAFFKHKMELFDAFIVITSFVLDILMIHGTAAEIIILFRLWRVTRIINGVVMSVKKKSEKEKQHLMTRNEELSEEVHQSELKITAQKKEIAFLRQKLESMGIKVDEMSETNSA